MAAVGTFSQRVIDLGARLRGLSRASLGALGLICAGGPAAYAANFTCSWNDATANWTTVADWSNCNGTFPNNSGGNTFDATIAQGNPSLTTTITIGSVTITTPGAWTTTSTGSATISGATSSGTVQLSGAAKLNDVGDFANSGALNLDTSINDGGGNVTIGGTLSNTLNNKSGSAQVGNVSVSGNGSRTYGLSAATSLTLGGLSNPSGASFQIIGSPSHAATLAFSAGGSGFTSNAGDFELFYAAPLSLPGNFTNSGTFGLHNNTAMTIGGGFTNSGSLAIDTGVTVFGGGLTYTEGGSSLTIGGTLNNTSTVQLGNVGVVALSGTRQYSLNAPASLTLGGLSNPSGASFQIIGSPSHAATLAFSAGGSGFTSNGGDFELFYAAPLSLPGNFTNSGTFGLHNNTAVTIGGGFANSASLAIDTGITVFGGGLTYTEGGSSLTIGGTLNNTSTVQLGNVGVVALSGTRQYSLNAPASMTLGGLSNPSGASFQIIGSPSHAATLAFSAGGSGFTSNAGDFELFYAAPLSLPGNFTNSGTFGLHNNTAMTIGGGFTNSGSLAIDTGVTVFGGGLTYTEGGSSLTIGGTLNNTSTVQLGNVGVVALSGTRQYSLNAPASLTLGGLSNPSGASFQIIGSPSHAATLAFSAGGSGFTSNGGDFELFYAAPLSLPGNFTNSGTFGLHNNTAVTIGGGFANSASLAIDTGITVFGGGLTYTEGGSSLTIGGTLNNTSTVQLGNVGVVALSGTRQYSLNAPASLTLGGLSNTTTGTISLFGNGTNLATLSITAGTALNSGDLELHNHTVLNTAAGVNLTNGGTLNIDTVAFTGGGEGGSTGTVGGTLSNTATFNIGNTGLSAPTMVTAAGFNNTGTVSLLGNTSNSNNQAKLTVNGQASNSGTVNIPTATSVTVTGAGNAYTQTAGFTNLSGGSLAAPSVNITGGTLRGMGTVTGATNISGSGTIQAINLANGNLAAVLTIDGNYFQSAGTFSELLHGTGVQLDKVAVTTGHTVNLTGGNLQLSGVTFALGQVFSNIMTFQPGELTGTFATIQGGGNGTFVDIGNGLRLTAIYDNAGGDISIQVLGTPPGKIWIDATGNWTTDTTKWSPTGAPVVTDDVTIGSTNNGNVTLDNTTTIKSLIINQSNALTNTTGTTLTVSTTVANSGSLTLGGNLTASGAVTNNSGATLAMQGGTLSAPSFNNAGTTSGFGTINPAIVNTGLVQASGSTLTAQNGIQGTTGNITINPAATLDLSKSGTGSTVGALTQNGTLNLGANNITVSTAYTNANFGTGNSFEKRANVTGSGQIQAAGNVAQAVTGSQVTNGTSATPTLALGNLHVGGSTSVNYSVANTGTTGPTLIGAIQTNINGGNITNTALSGSGVAAQNFGPIAAGTSTNPFTVTYAPTTAGALNGQAVHLANNYGNVGEQTMSITGAAYNLASSNTIAPINFGVLHVGDPTATRALSIMNTAPAGAFSEGLDSSFGSYTNNGGTLTPGFAGSITNLAAGSTNSTSMTASLSTAAAGAVNGNITVHQASNGTISGLGPTALPDQTPAVTGAVSGTITNLAAPQINNSPITFAARTGDAVGTKGVSITNAAPDSLFTEGLIGNVTGTTGTGITAAGGFGPPTANPELAGQQTNATFIQVGIDASTAGVKAGNAVIDFKSDGTPFGGTISDLGNTNVAVSGKVYTPAVATVLTTSPIDFGIVHVGDGGGTLAKSVSVQNGATATALNDGLVGSISAGGAPYSGSGTIAAPGLAPQASSSALQVNLATATAGIFTGTANLALASHDADLADLALSTSPLALNAQVNRFAALAFLKQGGDGALSDSFVLDFGDVLQGSGTREALLAMMNNNPLAAQLFTDLLSSTGTVQSGSGFGFTGCSVSNLPGGVSQPGCDIFFDTSSLGDFTEVLSFDVESSNSSGYDQVIGNVTLTLEGSVSSSIPTPEPGTITVLASGLGVLFFVVRRRRRMA